MTEPFPEWIEPMAATLTQERFVVGPEWLFERKFDGIRLLAFKNGADVTLYSRNRLPQQLPAVAAAVSALPLRDAILDGELTWETESLGYHVFDIVRIDGRDVSRLPLVERRALLAGLPFRAPLHHVREIVDGDPWETARTEGWEGVIAKRRDSVYEHRRSRQWLKMKCEVTHDFVVGGFTDPRGSRSGLGALLVGYYEGNEFVFAGKVGTGFDTRLLNALRARLDESEIERAPFTRATGLPRLGEHWVKPEIVVRVAFVEWTVHGKLRHSRLLDVLDDADPRDVMRTEP